MNRIFWFPLSLSQATALFLLFCELPGAQWAHTLFTWPHTRAHTHTLTHSFLGKSSERMTGSAVFCASGTPFALTPETTSRLLWRAYLHCFLSFFPHILVVVVVVVVATAAAVDRLDQFGLAKRIWGGRVRGREDRGRGNGGKLQVKRRSFGRQSISGSSSRSRKSTESCSIYRTTTWLWNLIRCCCCSCLLLLLHLHTNCRFAFRLAIWRFFFHMNSCH